MQILQITCQDVNSKEGFKTSKECSDKRDKILEALVTARKAVEHKVDMAMDDIEILQEDQEKLSEKVGHIESSLKYLQSVIDIVQK